jgi:hypothetical protein
MADPSEGFAASAKGGKNFKQRGRGINMEGESNELA